MRGRRAGWGGVIVSALPALAHGQTAPPAQMPQLAPPPAPPAMAPAQPSARTPPQSGTPAEARAVYDDIKATLGLVPSFVRAFPEQAVGAAWEKFKALELNPRTALPSKYKDLIGLAVGAQMGCHNCVYWDTEASRIDGAEDRERQEAVAMSALTRHWSTVLNGAQIDENTFRQEVADIMEHVRHPSGASPAAPAAITDSQSAYQDMRSMFGAVPSFMKAYPEPGVAAAWKEMKAVQLSSQTAIPPRYKELIGLGVAAQIPCWYCTLLHTEAARADGATDGEIRETLAIAASVRQWSTVLAGSQETDATFKRETDQVMKHLRRGMAAAERRERAAAER